MQSHIVKIDEIWQKCTGASDWKNIFWIEAASFIGAGTVYQKVYIPLGKRWLVGKFFSINLLALSFFFLRTDKLKLRMMATFIEINNTVGPNRTKISQQTLYIIHKNDAFKPGSSVISYKCEQIVWPLIINILIAVEFLTPRYHPGSSFFCSVLFYP